MNWNKGSAFLLNRLGELQSIIQQYSPHILVVTELQLFKEDSISQVQIPGYSLEHDNLFNLFGVSRVGMYISDTIGYRRRNDLEDDQTASLWITTRIKGSKPININGFYRQWQLPRHKSNELNPKNLNNKLAIKSDTVNSQNIRLNKVLKNWCKAKEEGHETITLSDMNVDSLQWGIHPTNQTYHHRKLLPLVVSIRDQALNKGFTKIKTAATRSSPGVADTCLDHFYTTRPELIAGHKLITFGASDHLIGLFYRANRAPIAHARYTINRDYTNFKVEDFTELVTRDPRYIECLQATNVDIASNLLTSLIADALAQLAPTIKSQLRIKKPKFLTARTRETEKKEIQL